MKSETFILSRAKQKMFWEDEKEEKRNEKFDAGLTKLVDVLSVRSSLFRFLWICISLNVVLWLCNFFFHEFVNGRYRQLFGASNKIAIGVLFIPLALGFFITYTLCRLKFPDIEENNLQSEMMATYN
ncbi:MAG TPA: hypothetical protein VGB00_04300, partial [Pyrinomonadaceae bacterium]